jgi:hypothetical protein
MIVCSSQFFLSRILKKNQEQDTKLINHIGDLFHKEVEAAEGT